MVLRRHEAESPPRRPALLRPPALLLLLAGTALFSLIPPAVRAEPVRIGVLLPLSGDLAPIGRMERHAFSLAAEEINRRGGVRGRGVALDIVDTRGDPDAAVTAARGLLAGGPAALLTGGCSSTAGWALAAHAQRQKIPFLVTTASANRITEKGWEYVFRLAGPWSDHWRPLSSFLTRATDIRTAGIIRNQDLGDFLYRRLLRLFKQLDIRVTMREPFGDRPGSLQGVILEAMLRHPDLLCLIDRARGGAALLDRSRELGVSPKMWLGATTDFSSPGFAKHTGPAAEYLYAVALWHPGLPYPGADAFYRTFEARFGAAPDYHAAQAYASMQVIEAALNRATALEPDPIRTALAETDRSTVFGPVRFGAFDGMKRQNRPPGLLIQWLEGAPRIVWPGDLATAEFVYPLPPWFRTAPARTVPW